MRLALLLVFLPCLGCRDAAAPPKPRYERGPGCTVTARHQLESGIEELTVYRFGDCVSVVWDSTLVR